MAMTKCKECCAQVSNQAKHCPSCGIARPGGGLGRGKTWFLMLLVAAVMIGIMIEDRRDRVVKAAPVLSAEKLYAFYRQDRAAADSKITGKIIKVQGEVIYGATASTIGKYQVGLRGGSRSEQVIIRFPPAHKAYAQGLKPGDNITVTGVADGMTLAVLFVTAK